MDRRLAFPFFRQFEVGTLVIASLVLLIYVPLLWHWVDGWLNKSVGIDHEYFSHGLIGIPYAAYLSLVVYRPQWQELKDRFHALGAFLMAIAVVLHLSGTIYAVNLSFPLLLIGLCLCLKGIPGLKLNAFPLLLIFLATPNPIPYLLTPYTLPLQTFIANVAGFILMQLGIQVSVDQFYLFVNDKPVEVAPYCAGLKMLFTSLYVTLILLHWTGNLKDRSKTLFMLISAILISVSANILRNTLLAWFHGTGRDGAFDWLHEGWGGDVYSMIMLLAIVWLNQNLDRFGFQSPDSPDPLPEER
jgi:cyanoexosortase B